MKYYSQEQILGLPVNVINLDDEVMGIRIEYEPIDSGDSKVPKGKWSIWYSDSGSVIRATGKSLVEATKKIKVKIDELNETPLRI